MHDFREAPSERSVRSRPPAPAANDPHEAEWVRRAVEGDGAAFAEIVRAYSTRIYSHLYGIVGNREDAEDLAQEAFVRAYRALASFDRSRPLRSWLYAIATRVGLNGLRARRRRIPAGIGEGEGGPEPADPAGDVRAAVLRGELEERVTALLSKLPPRSAMLMHLHYREGMTIGEAAEVVGMTEGAAKVALMRARRSLREWLIEEEL